LSTSRVGTLDWIEETGGRLRPRDRIRLLGQGVLAQLFVLPLPVGGRLGLRPRRLARFDLERLRIPDSPACREAEEVCAQMRPELLVNHSYRTYVWGSILAAHDGLRYDEEVVYISSLLHDLGLSEQHEPAPPPVCFTLVGARAVEQAGAAAAWEDRRRRTAAEAITLHLNLRVQPSDGVEAYVVAAGAQLDAVGARYWRIDPATREAVLARYPRHGVKQGFVRIFGAHAKTHPGSRAHFYDRYLAIRTRLRAAPFEE
jgi:hypothetical protein